MACAKPLIVVTGIQTPLYNFLIKKNCAELVYENRNIGFTDAILKLSKDETLRKKLGKNGYNYIVNDYSKKIIVKKYVSLLNSL